MIEFLFLDLDDTILDFHKAERIALGKTLEEFGLEPTEQVRSRYHVINKACWEKLETGEWTRQQVLVGRYELLFREFGISADPQSCADTYTRHLSVGHWFLPGAEEAVKQLSQKYRLFLASNGTASVQHGRIASAGLYPLFEGIFISQELGANKPSPVFFENAFARIKGFAPERALMVGDSLTSDIRGGINAGIKTCWVNPAHAAPNPQIPADYEIESITQLEALLETL